MNPASRCNLEDKDRSRQPTTAVAAVVATIMEVAAAVEEVGVKIVVPTTTTPVPTPPPTTTAPSTNAGGNDKKQRCQLCFKPGHTVITCWHRFNADFVPDTNRSAAAASASQGGGDSIWYTDTGATDHITGELDKLAVHERYNGTDQIRTASGAGMDINRIGHSVIHTPSRDLHLKNILHAPQPPKILFPSIV
jgi:hypothetical protein